RARLAVALAAPVGGALGIGALALTLVTRPELERAWLAAPAMGSLPARSMAARLLERAAREAVRRRALGDRGALAAFIRPSVTEVWRRLILDRESLVWRHAAIARGLVAHFDSDLAAEMDRELAPDSSPSEHRRAATSLAAAIEVRPEAIGACHRAATALCVRDRGVARAFVQGLAGGFAVEPEAVDKLALELVELGELDAIEALVDLRRDLDGAVMPRTAAAAAWWLDRALATDRGDDGQTALRSALRDELAASASGPLGEHAAAARAALVAGDLPGAVRAARAAVDEIAAMVDWLERASDDDPIDRRHELRVLRELDREVLADAAIGDILALGEGVGSRALAELLARAERRLLASEAAPETRAPVPHHTLRLARLRALIRLLDAEAPGEDDTTRRERRSAAVRTLLVRAPRDTSPLRRAVWAGLARAWDALLRDEQADLADLLVGLTAASDPDDDFAIVREATMVPEVETLLDAYADTSRALAAAADPDDLPALGAALAQVRRLADALPVAASPRTEALRLGLARAADAAIAIASAASQAAVPDQALDDLENATAALGQLGVGARRRLGLPAGPESTSDTAIRAVALALERQRRGVGDGAADEIAAAIAQVRADQLPVVATAIERVLARVALLPRTGDAVDVAPLATPALPPWLPLGRTIGGFYVVRPIGKGAGGSVFVACRSEERHRPSAGLVALKVPDYGGGAARNLSEQEFETMFREEAGALLSLPTHGNLARFVTFDAGARPKPILVMELVRGPSLERVLEVQELELAGALALIDGIAAGLEAMHAARVAHLDLKPANVILREGTAAPVLVDFGLAGRNLRPGCGSPHYGGPEVWSATSRSDIEPFATDVYAFGCLAYELLTGEVLVTGDSLQGVLALHLSGRAGKDAFARLARQRGTGGLADLLGAALALKPSQRPSIARLRAGFAAVAPDLRQRTWPLGA
ncbi:MAG: protein kinase, partial [Deltaproteobacteria bacterium]|nr:protein kinase [Deltaproteobacteria bacterium]